MRKTLAILAILAVGFTLGAKKMNVMNFDKGQMWNDNNGVEVNLTEEHAVKKGSMMCKVSVAKKEKGIAWVASSNGKIWDGFDVLKVTMFNPQKTPIKIRWDYQPGKYVGYQQRFVQDVMLKPGVNEVEIELTGACANDGNPIDFKQKVGCFGWAFDNKPEGYDIYMSSHIIETQEDSK